MSLAVNTPKWRMTNGGAFSGIAGPIVFATVIVICGSMRPGYSHVGNFISELGQTGSPRATLMNVLGFIPTGTLMAAFGLSMIELGPARRAQITGAVLLMVSGIGVLLAGFFPCDPGCPVHNLTPTARIHRAASITAFLTGILGIATFARVFRTLAAWRSLWVYSAVSAAGALNLLVIVATYEESRWLIGLWQRLLVLVIHGWFVVIGWHRLRGR